MKTVILSAWPSVRYTVGTSFIYTVVCSNLVG